MHPSSMIEKFGKTGMFTILFLLVVQSLAPIVAAGNGVSTSSSSGVGTTDTITNGFSSVSSIGNGYDSSTSSHAKLIADGDSLGILVVSVQAKLRRPLLKFFTPSTCKVRQIKASQ